MYYISDSFEKWLMKLWVQPSYQAIYTSREVKGETSDTNTAHTNTERSDKRSSRLKKCPKEGKEQNSPQMSSAEVSEKKVLLNY